jgi:uncharacterized membrane protein YjjP (DUF1212 family)
MIARYNRWSFVFGAPGIILQIAGTFIGPWGPAYSSILLGTVLLMIGLGYYAKAKGQSFAWCAAGFLSVLGLLLLLLLEDKSESTQGVGERHEKA